MKYAITPTRIRLVKQLLDESKKRQEALRNLRISGLVSTKQTEDKAEPAEEAAE